jgi:hypothetical protein
MENSIDSQQQFLAQAQFTSEQVKTYVTIELGLNSKDDFDQHANALKTLIQTFTPEEQIEYLTIIHQWYQFKYANYPLALRLIRLHELSELSLRVPIDMIQPVRFIEYMTLAKTIPTFQRAMQNFTPLADYITQFVANLHAEPPKPKKRKPKKAKKAIET